ncbi:uncharacterized protein N7506_012018 [Penicillium brevicompactum]|uniref:uncharacterized protein n=1 Tax=Penicillium brevicompactum TaxID=5074 RepID=UPI0025413547|nr:uncharacterized protein N7506_012018 [Penicillium brevicompactum]KAJ5319314.1 hypothetical protein N7506_012018 [Penicillium brevicompactum]
MKHFRYAFAIFTLYVQTSVCTGPRQMTWSTKSFGPDGPWQAVNVIVGSNSSDLMQPTSEVALYPGGSWESKILLSSLCDNQTLSPICYAEQAGLFNSDKSMTLDNTSIQLPPYGTWDDLEWGYTNAVPIYARARRATDWINIQGTPIPEVDLILIRAGWQTYPNGQAYPLEVGTLSLGSPELNQTFGSTIKINTTFVNSYLYDQGGVNTIPSYSYGMHIGSASLGIPGSLHLGGYDQSRVIGEVSSQSFNSGSFPIQLFDISLGVAEGGSAWSYSNKSELLAQGNSSLSSGLTVIVDPTNPYIYLPQSSCDALAAELPVTYQPDYGLYFWDTSDPQYNKILTSPSYLAFRFSKNSLNNADITIKVPFALLNLTLEAPLVETPTQYFPCMPTNSTPVLGRAFLQAAFVGVNWLHAGKWYLAQAPGPDASFIVNTATMDEKNPSVSGSASSWEDTWKGQWVPLPETSTEKTSGTDASNDNSTSDTGLSTGAKIGIIVGSAVGGALVLAIIITFCIRHRRKQTSSQSHEDMYKMVDDSSTKTNEGELAELSVSEWKQLNELAPDRERYEIGSERGPFYELAPEKKPVTELGNNKDAHSQCGPFELPDRSSVSKSQWI